MIVRTTCMIFCTKLGLSKMATTTNKLWAKWNLTFVLDSFNFPSFLSATVVQNNNNKSRWHYALLIFACYHKLNFILFVCSFVVAYDLNYKIKTDILWNKLFSTKFSFVLSFIVVSIYIPPSRTLKIQINCTLNFVCW